MKGISTMIRSIVLALAVAGTLPVAALAQETATVKLAGYNLEDTAAADAAHRKLAAAAERVCRRELAYTRPSAVRACAAATLSQAIEASGSATLAAVDKAVGDQRFNLARAPVSDVTVATFK
jgi:UrcA family protein